MIRWVVAVVVVLAIVALIIWARGLRERGEPVGSPSPAAVVELVAA